MERDMLVLTRKLNQEIVIGDDIRITIVAVFTRGASAVMA